MPISGITIGGAARYSDLSEFLIKSLKKNLEREPFSKRPLAALTAMPPILSSDRAGKYITQSTGYRAFVPNRLPPDPPIKIEGELQRLLSGADRALGRLDGVASTLPNPSLFVAMYVRHEAVLSSQIEGTQSSLDDLLIFEADGRPSDEPKDVAEVVNYVAAMNHGLARLPELPLSKRLLCEVHEKLLTGVRGGEPERTPGEFRKSQNWIGAHGCTLNEAAFVPPPVHELMPALDDLERFLHDRDTLPILVHVGVAHAQFETIHPYLDSNGRVGRLLITLLLCEREIMQKPLLYLSYFFKANCAEYYDRLTAIRHNGDWEGWLRFFLRGVYEVSLSATDTARAILKLREKHRELVSRGRSGVNALRLLDRLFEAPVITARGVQHILGMSADTSNKLVSQFEKQGVLSEMTGKRRNRVFRYAEYLDLFQRPLQRPSDS